MAAARCLDVVLLGFYPVSTFSYFYHRLHFLPSSFLPNTPAAIYHAQIDFLRRDTLFARLTQQQLARLLGKLEPVTLAAGAMLFERGAKAASLYLIEDGEVQLCADSGRTMRLQSPRCGEEAATSLKSYLTSAMAVTAVRAWRLPREALAELAQLDAGLADRSLLGMASHLSGETLHASPAARPLVAGADVAPLPAAAATVKTPAEPRPWGEIIGWLTVTLLPPALYLGGSAAGLSVEAAVFVAILSATVAMWVFNLADEFVPPLLAISAVLMVGLVPPEVALAGFSSRTLTTLIGVYALACLMASSGLSYRFMVWVLIRMPDTRIWQQTALLLSGYLLSPIMPSSNARLSLLLPFYRDMSSSLGLKPKSNASTALMAATFSGAMLFSPMMLTSKSANLTVFGMLPEQVQAQFQGIFWLVAAGVAALTVTLVHFAALRWSFVREHQAALPKSRLRVQMGLLGPITGPEKAALAGFLLFVAGAASTSWHQINPAWLAAFILVALLLAGLVSKKDFQQKIDWPMIFFLLSLDGLSRCISYLGLDTALSQAVGNRFDFVNGNLLLFIPVVLVVTVVLRLALPITAGMVVAAVVLMPVAMAQNINPWVLGFLAALFSDMWFKPYQNSSYLQVIAGGYTRYFAEPGFMRYNQIMNLARILAAYLSVPWWDWLGLA